MNPTVVRNGLSMVALGTMAFGAWSAMQPTRSIALYQAIMRVFNWRVEPIDQPRELRTSRFLGIALVLLGLLTLVLLRRGD